MNAFEQFDNSSMLNIRNIFLIVLLINLIVFLICIIKNSKINKKYNKKIEETENKYSYIIDRYYTMIVNDLELTKLRKKTILSYRLGISLIIIGFLGFPIFKFYSPTIAFLGFILFIDSKNKNYEKAYKDKIVKKVMLDYDYNLEYIPNGLIPQSQYDLANFEKYYNIYESEDRISGKICGLDFQMADVHVIRRKHRHDSYDYITLFNGPVAIFELPNDISLELSIVCNKLSSYNKENKIEINNPLFEEIYDVYTNDRIKTMEFLSPILTNKLIELYNIYKFKFEIKAFDRYLYFRFHSGNLFVPCIKNPKEEATRIALYIEILDGIKEIMSEIIININSLDVKN